MKTETRAQVEQVCGAVPDGVYTMYCAFVDAVNAEQKENPGKTEQECFRDLFNWTAKEAGLTQRI